MNGKFWNDWFSIGTRRQTHRHSTRARTQLFMILPLFPLSKAGIG